MSTWFSDLMPKTTVIDLVSSDVDSDLNNYCMEYRERMNTRSKKTMAPASDVATEYIAPRGDVILIVEEKPKRRLQVSSAVLIANSPVFAAMLGPHFREGQTKGTSQAPKTISLPDDTAAAMSDLCSLLHFATPKELVSSPKAKRILQLAIAADKYACVEKLQLQIGATLLTWNCEYPKMSVGATGHLFRMVVAAYLLDHALAFEIFTGRLVKESHSTFSELANTDHGKLLPTTVYRTLTRLLSSTPKRTTKLKCLCRNLQELQHALNFIVRLLQFRADFATTVAFEEQRASARLHISENLPLLGLPLCTNPTPCRPNTDAIFMATLITRFGSRYWPPRFQEHEQLTTVISTIKSLGTIDRSYVTCAHSGRRSNVTGTEFADFAAEVESMCMGLCLQCVEEGVLDLQSECSHDAAVRS